MKKRSNKSLGLVENMTAAARRRAANPDGDNMWPYYAVPAVVVVGAALFYWGMTRVYARQGQAVQGAARVAVKSETFHLRPTATAASTGQELVAGTRLTMLEPTGIVRGQGTLWRVRTDRGMEGWTFILPSEIQA